MASGILVLEPMAERTPAPTEDAELRELRLENARLRKLLRVHGINDRLELAATAEHITGHTQPAARSAADKIALFRRLFRGREDVFAIRWEGKSGRAGYAPACSNEWRPGLCNKPKVKCAQCQHRAFVQLDDQVIYDHLAGVRTIGFYALLPDDTCCFLGVDFDDEDWRQDVQAFRDSCDALGIPVSVEISRSGAGAHAWLFFEEPILAADARRLGSAVISHACARTGQLSLSSYDRLFPNQDTVPKGGFGNLIALPLQKAPRERGCSVFVDRDLNPFDDQWAYLAFVQRMSRQDVQDATHAACPSGYSLDVAFIEEEDYAQPWKVPKPAVDKIPGSLPDQLHITLANQLYFDKTALPPPLLNRLVRLVAFQNPEFYKAQALRRSVWDKPRNFGRAENFPRHVALPRGCLDAVLELFAANEIEWTLSDERVGGKPIDVPFVGELREEQAQAAQALLPHDTGVLVAPTAFGKTVVSAHLIAVRQVSTLVLVHRTELLKQWQARLQSFLDLPEEAVGVVGGGRKQPTANIDVAVIQSVVRRGEVDELVRNYEQVIVDECHHISAKSFEDVSRAVPARYVLGLTATPIRRDGQQAIIFMQCGPTRYRAASRDTQPEHCAVVVQEVPAITQAPADIPVHELFRQLVEDPDRNDRIVADVVEAFEAGRHVLLLSERAGHVTQLASSLEGRVGSLFCLHGRMGRRQRAEQLAGLDRLSSDSPRVLIATGKLIGEGFDHPVLDTLVLAHPISWRGTLQQYAGRLHRDAGSKDDVRIYDYVDAHPITQSMWRRRVSGYRTMGYRINEWGSQLELPAR